MAKPYLYGAAIIIDSCLEKATLQIAKLTASFYPSMQVCTVYYPWSLDISYKK